MRRKKLNNATLMSGNNITRRKMLNNVILMSGNNTMRRKTLNNAILMSGNNIMRRKMLNNVILMSGDHIMWRGDMPFRVSRQELTSVWLGNIFFLRRGAIGAVVLRWQYCSPLTDRCLLGFQGRSSLMYGWTIYFFCVGTRSALLFSGDNIVLRSLTDAFQGFKVGAH